MAEILALGNDAQASDPITLADGETATVFLFGEATGQVPPAAQALIQIQGDTGDFYDIGILSGTDPAVVIAGAGTYQLYRTGETVTFGIWQA